MMIKKREPLFPEITTYWARHTWATIAHKIGISKDVISMALGHEFGQKVTGIYIDDYFLVGKGKPRPFKTEA